MALFIFKRSCFIKGTICRIESKNYYVLDSISNQFIRCTLRGRFKKEFKLRKDKLYKTDVAVVGDNVEFHINEDGTGVIHKIEDRRNYISRKAPRIKGASYRGERYEQVVAANIDNFFIISSVAKPVFNNKVIDRFIVSGESSHLNTTIVINKADLDTDNVINKWIDMYKSIGYKTIKTSVITGEGIDKLKAVLTGKKNLFRGHSGVGKTSILNKLYPELNLAVGSISNYNEKGTHTTVTSTMLRVSNNTFVIDTPGIREIDPYGIRKEDLGHYFIEFKFFINSCKFNTCTHHHEPGCAVIDAVKNDKISPQRYESYLKILDTIEDDMLF